MNISSIKSQIEKHEVISFDIYDTLIRRNVAEPEDIFWIVEKIYNKRISNDEYKVTEFKTKRVCAYEKAYEKLKAACTIDDIYDMLGDYSSKEKEILKQIEIEVETQICVANSQMTELFSYAKKKGKRIVIMSDMYLHFNIIKQILTNCGINGYDQLFVSCDYKKSKTDGKLYDICCETMKITPNQLLHLGDGIKNDVIRARQKGIHSIWIKGRNHLDYCNDNGFDDFEQRQYRIQQAFIQNHIDCIKGEVERLGFSVLGPLITGFCEWLHGELKKQSIEKVFFLAREGLLFKTIYETLYPDDNYIRKYLYVSRKSLIAPTYWIGSDYESVIKSIAKSKEITVATLLERWGLEAQNCIDEVHQVGLELNVVLDGQKLLNNFQTKKLYELLKEQVIEQSKEKYKLLKEYLAQENFGGKCAIIDVGWNGGMQNAFEKIASVWKEPTEIFGYYIGINPKNLGIALKNVNGFVYAEQHHECNRYYIYSFAGPLELSLTAPHNTTVGYRCVGENIEPVWGTGEYINEDGSFKPELLYTILVQNGIKRYAEYWKRECLMGMFPVNSEIAFRNCRLFGLNPKGKHIKLFYEFGANDLGVKQHFVNPKYKHLLGENNIIRGFWESTWKSGYMKMIFKLPFPYYKIYTYMRKKVN